MSYVSLDRELNEKPRKISKFKNSLTCRDSHKKISYTSPPEKSKYQQMLENKVNNAFEIIEDYNNKDQLNVAFDQLSTFEERVLLLDIIMKHKNQVRVMKYKVGLNAVMPLVRNFKKKRNSRMNMKEKEMLDKKTKNNVISNHYKKLKLAKNLQVTFEKKKSTLEDGSSAAIKLDDPSEVQSKYLEFLGKMSKLLDKTRSKNSNSPSLITKSVSNRDSNLKKQDLKMNLFQEFKKKQKQKEEKLQKYLTERRIKNNDKDSANTFDRHLNAVFRKNPHLEIRSKTTFQPEHYLRKFREQSNETQEEVFTPRKGKPSKFMSSSFRPQRDLQQSEVFNKTLSSIPSMKLRKIQS